MAHDPDPVTPIDALILETRAIREAVHELVERLQQDRRAWQRDVEALTRHSRLTAEQRQRLGARLGNRMRSRE
jgi:Spy/CpxP family protein refolding chaperone